MRAGNRDLVPIAALCILAALRVLVHGAAFPTFNNIDEPAHVDLVDKYSRGVLPTRDLAPFGDDVARLLVRHGSLEYIHPPTRFPGGRYPEPIWTLPPEIREQAIETAAARWSGRLNHETHAPPPYYLLAAGWYRLAGSLGANPGERVFLLRFLNAPMFALLVWLAYVCSRRAFPARTEMRIGVPLLLAFLPLDVFYGVNPDVLSPLIFTGGLTLLLIWRGQPRPSNRLSLAAGFMVGLAMAVKVTNLALPLVLLGFTVPGLIRPGNRKLKRAAALALMSAALPLLLIAAWNLATAGEPTGTRAKIAYLGWTSTTVSALFDHPLFTPEGIWTFWSELMHKLWRGELRWRLQPLASPAADTFYALSSTILLGVAAISTLGRKDRKLDDGSDAATRTAMWACFGFAVLTLASLSLAFDFGRSFYPSRDHPYFTSGRLISGPLVPFLALYVDGAARLVRRGPRVALTLAFLVLVAAGMTVSELIVNRPVYSSPFNWFHLVPGLE